MTASASSHLSTEQVRFFRHSGYLKAPAPLSAEATARLRQAVLDEARSDAEDLTKDEAGRVARIPGIYQRLAACRELCASEVLLGPLASLLGPNIELVLNRHNHATFNYRTSARPRLHRDILQWTRSVVTAIVYLEPSTLASGCTEIIPGSQYLPFVGTPNNGGTWMDEHSVYADLLGQALPVEMPAGGILFFDSLAFHGVGVNTTDDSRMSIALGFHSVDELNRATDATRVLLRGERLYRGNDRLSGALGA